jgi:hypothetical protein
MPTSPHRASWRARQAWITRPGRIMSRGRADMGRTLSPLIEEPCARMSQGARGLIACDRPRRVAVLGTLGAKPARHGRHDVHLLLQGSACSRAASRAIAPDSGRSRRSRVAPRSRGGLATSCARRASSVRRARGALRRRRSHAASRPKVPWRRTRRRSVDMPTRQPPSWRSAREA